MSLLCTKIDSIHMARNYAANPRCVCLASVIEWFISLALNANMTGSIPTHCARIAHKGEGRYRGGTQVGLRRRSRPMQKAKYPEVFTGNLSGSF